MTPDIRPIHRRRFLRVGAAGLLAPALLTSTARGSRKPTPPSDRLHVGVIGLGSRGFNLLDELLAQSDARITAICDVDELHYRDRPWGRGTPYGREAAKRAILRQYGRDEKLFVTDDFREVCSRDDVDVVVAATPDHWHALCTFEALARGKDVYCEKPVTHTFAEGLAVCRDVAARRAVFQTGSQQRSDPLFRRAVELVRNGQLGQVTRFQVGLPPGYDVPQDSTEITTPPKSCDYELWTGPAPMLPYMRARHHRWWRGHRAYGGGVLMDWIGHHNDIAHWALDLDHAGPLSVEAVGWEFPETDVYNTPFQYGIRSEYPGGVIGTVSSQDPVGLRIEGDRGWVFVTRGRLETSDPKWSKPDFRPGSVEVERSDNHMRNFLDSVKSRRPCICPAETGHRSITPGHLAYVSQALSRKLRWDATSQVVIDDEPANTLLNELSYRQPWTQP